jgi:hypothetical protein
MGTVRTWWQRLTGRKSARPAVAPDRPAATGPARSSKASAGPGLQLVDAPGPKRPSKVGAAGFDPYSSDAGYSKPHSWERVDHD